MDRRKFIGTLGAAGAAALLGRSTARAQAAPSHDLPLFVNAVAQGGWDVTQFCDPKSDGGRLYPINNFSPADYVQAGNFVLAPSSVGAAQFFKRYFAKILLINGIFAETIDHTTGQQLATCGSTQQMFPCFNALVAAAAGRSLGLPFISGGNSYAETNNLVAKTLANPSVVNAMGGVTSASAAYTTDDLNTLAQAVAARLARKQASARSTNRGQQIALLAQAREGWSAFPGVLQTLADLRANVPISDGGVVGGPNTDTSANNQMILGIQLGLAGYVNNATVSLNLNYLNFDQHTDMAGQPAILDSYFVALDYLMRAAAHLNVADKIFLMGASDFSRSPHIINPGASPGRDHWFGTTSVMVMGPGITGNRTLGQTTDGYGDPDDSKALQAMPLDPNTLQPSASGVLLTRAHIHAELRRVANLSTHPLNAAYPLNVAPSAAVRLFE